jgi:plastocyanin
MRRIRLPGVAFALLLWLSLSCVAAGASLKGTVVMTGPVPPQKKLEVTNNQYICGTEKEPGDLILSARKEVSNAVVWIDNPPAGAGSFKDAKVEMDQKACAFIPRIVIVPAGETMFFLNSDRLLHNIHATPSLNVAINMAQPRNRSIPATFVKPEIVRIGCDLHPWMRAWVVVAAHPWYAITGPEGQFAFDNLPPGQYKLNAWHERLGKVEMNATVGEQPAQIRIEMKAR